MESNREKFLELRAEEFAVMYDHTFTKKDAINTGKKMVDEILEKGEIDPVHIWTNICRLKEVINSADAEFRNRLDIYDKTNVNGVEFNHVNGGENLNYKDDPIYLDLFNELKEREELIKLAYKSKNEIFDYEGIEVTKVSSSPRKSSITVRF